MLDSHNPVGDMALNRRSFLVALAALPFAGKALEKLAAMDDPILYVSLRGPLVVNEIGKLTNYCPECGVGYDIDSTAFDPEVRMCSECYERQRLIIAQLRKQGQQAIDAMIRADYERQRKLLNV